MPQCQVHVAEMWSRSLDEMSRRRSSTKCQFDKLCCLTKYRSSKRGSNSSPTIAESKNANY